MRPEPVKWRREANGLSEVGLPHSSEEACESRWSKGGSKQSIPEQKQRRHGRSEPMEQEAKGIRYQSEHFLYCTHENGHGDFRGVPGN